MNNKLYKTYAEVKVASLIEPNDKTKALANFVTQSLGYEFLSQADLLYIRSVLVTAGMNANDDVFFVEELWKARYSPILKPLNIEHNEKDIIGVMFNISARDLSKGGLIDLNATNFTDPFEIVSEGVIYQLLFPSEAQNIRTKAEVNELFVSMEAWFKDYDYVVVNSHGEIEKIIARNSETVFLDQCLKAFGGNGIYIDPDAKEEKRLGRGLRDIIFGGCGIVKNPANARSIIENIGNPEKTIQANQNNDEELHKKLVNLINKLDSFIENENMYASVGNNKEVEMSDKLAKDDINAVLDEREQKKKVEAEIESLQKKAAKVDELESVKKELEDKITAMQSDFDTKIKAANDLIDGFIKMVTDKKIGISTEQEDKLVWLKDAFAYLVNRAENCDKYEQEIKAAKINKRADEVKAMFGEIFAEEEINIFIEKVKAMEDPVYDEWKKEKEVLIAKLNKKKEEKKEEMKKEEKKEETKASKDDDVDAKILDSIKVEESLNIAAASQGNSVIEPDGMSEAVAFIYSVDVADDSGKDKNSVDPDNE